MKYDFVEIGTSNFNTLIESAGNNTVGISIEPILYYLNCLPNKVLVKKLNIAISPINKRELIEVYYIPENIINALKLPDWLKGCNSVGNYHYQHLQLNLQHLVVKNMIESIPIKDLFDENNITSLDYLKIDTEGTDADILSHLFIYLSDKPKSYFPKKICFESNSLTEINKIKNIIQLYMSIGYKVVYSHHDTLIEL